MSAKDWVRRMSLRSQISTLAVLTLALSLLVMGWITYRTSSRLAQDLTLEKAVSATSDATTRVQTALDRARLYTATTPEFPPIPGLVRCRDNDDVDPIDEGSTTEKWLDRLSTILQTQMLANPDQSYNAVVDEQGNEILRIERSGDRLRRVDDPRDVSDDEFFTEAMNLPRGDVFVDHLKQDGASLVINFATPYFGKSPGPARGVFVIGLDGRQLLDGAVRPIKDGWVDIVDEQGMYLFSNDPSISITPLDDDRYADHKPVRAEAMKNNEPEYDSYADFIAGHKRPDGVALVAAYRKVFYAGNEDRSRFWAIAPSVVADQALRTTRDLAGRFLFLGAVVLAVAAIITYVIAGGLTSSLRRLADAADMIAGGSLDTELPEIRHLGEVDTLYKSFSAMTGNLRETIDRAQDQQRKTEAIFQSTADAIITIDEHGIIQAFNLTAEKMFGYNADEVIGTNVSRLTPSPHREEHDSYLERYHRTGQARILNTDRELSAVRKDGSEFPISLRVREIAQQGIQRTYIGTIQDITDLKTNEGERQRLFDAIRDAVNRLSTSCQEITSTTSQQAAGAHEQATAITETVATVEQISQTAEQAAERANTVAKSARQAEDVGKDGQQAVQNSIAAMGKVKNEVESIAQSILALAERAQAIGEIIATVSDIAEQTNVLALNAAVEASRAGEHGKGFSVVASEVKSLAEESKKATAQVRQILGEIQQAMNQTVLSTEQGTKSTDAAEVVVNQAGDTIRSLSETLAQSVRLAMQISASANQQASGLVQLNHGIKNIDTVAKQNVAAINQIEQAANRLNGLSHELASLTSNGQVG